MEQKNWTHVQKLLGYQSVHNIDDTRSMKERPDEDRVLRDGAEVLLDTRPQRLVALQRLLAQSMRLDVVPHEFVGVHWIGWWPVAPATRCWRLGIDLDSCLKRGSWDKRVKGRAHGRIGV